MSKIMLDKDALDNFSNLFRECCSCLQLSLHEKTINTDYILDLLEIQKLWETIYSPDIQNIKKLRRRMYTKYLDSKKEGNEKESKKFYEIYMSISEQLKLME